MPQNRITANEQTAKVLSRAIDLCPALKSPSLANDLLVAKFGDRFLEWLEKDGEGLASLPQPKPSFERQAPPQQEKSQSLPPLGDLMAGFLAS